jgi:proteic killer suppression protein
VIQSFANEGTEDVFNGRSTKKARAVCPTDLWRVAARKLDQLDSVERLDELATPPGNRLGTLVGDRAGRHSIRINERYRVCFAWTESGPADVEITDYHR